MSAERYSLDANILFYALDHEAGEKHRLAIQLWLGMRHRSGILAVQTLCETYWAVHRKRPQDLPTAHRLLTLAAARLPIVTADTQDFLEAASMRAARPVHFWDALLASTLRRNHCRVLLTEDAQDRSAEFGLRRLNPFQETTSSLAAYLTA